MLPIRFALPALLLALAVPLRAAVSIDIDLARLRALPGADAIAERLVAALPASARERLADLDQSFGFAPGRDLQRIVVTVPDIGAPSVRLVGLPAERIAAALALAGPGTAYPNGLVGHPLPQRPQASFVVVTADQALIGRGATLAGETAPPAALPLAVAGQAVVLRLVPGAAPHLPAMKLVERCELRLDGAGAVRATVQAHDAAGADELERRFAGLQRMVAAGAEGGLERMAELAPVLAGATVARTGTTLEIAATIPAEVRARAIERLVERLTRRLGAG